MLTDFDEPACIATFREWVHHHGAWIHPALRFVSDDSGMSVVTTEPLPENTPVLSCPFDLVITPQSSVAALRGAFGDLLDTRLEQLAPRQLMVCYIIMHLTHHDSKHFKHDPYFATLPRPSQLLTPLYFKEEETKLLGGSNVAHTAKDRDKEWERQMNQAWPVFQRVFGAHLVFTWENWRKANTWISSRAFPSSILSVENANLSSPDSEPVLVPVIDCLNHKRAQPVTWQTSRTLLSQARAEGALENGPYVSLVHHPALEAGLQVFNNYGPKPNAELLLGFGFTIPNNPEDNMLLLLAKGKRYELGREARGVIPLWTEVKRRIDPADDGDWKTVMDASQALADMILAKLDNLEVGSDEDDADDDENVRPLVRGYIKNYMDGQRDILESVYDFCQQMQRQAVEQAKKDGVELPEDIFDDDSDD